MGILEILNWRLGHIGSVWWQSHRDLAYVNEPFNDPESEKVWRNLGYSQSRFTGDLYDMRRPEPDWIDPFREMFKWQNWAWSVYRMCPGTVIPNHRDTYVRYREIYGVKDLDSIWRAVVFLEDWQSGHYFEIDHVPVTGWKAGDYAVWQNDTQHLAANMGETPRFTLQITGTSDENSFL